MASKATQKMTGTEKKARDVLARGIRKQAPIRAKGDKKVASFMHGGMRNTAIEKDLKKTMGSLEQYRHSEPYKGISEFTRGGKAYKGAEDFSGLKPFEYGGKAYSTPDFYKEGKQGLKMAQEVLAPIQRNTLREFGLSTLPGTVVNQGFEGGRSSALTQALAAAKQNLASQLDAQTSALTAQYGGDISRMNLSERARQQEMQQNTALNRSQMNMAQQAQQNALQYGAASDIFQGKRAASMGLDEQRRANIEYLNNLAFQASMNSQNAGLAGMQGAFQPNYIRGGGSGGISPVAGGLMGGLSGAASGAAIGSAVPGIGTAIGAGVGGLIGLGGGIFASR